MPRGKHWNKEMLDWNPRMRMPSLAMEKVCHYRVKGLTWRESLKRAGLDNKFNRGRVISDPRMKARIAFLVEQAAKKIVLTKRDVLRWLVEDRALARKVLQLSPAIRAAELVGKELGMFVDRKDIRIKRLQDMTKDELRALLSDIDDGDVDLGEEDD